MNTIYEKSNELADAFEKLLGFTMIKSKRWELAGEEIDLKEFLCVLFENAARRAKGKSITWKAEGVDGLKLKMNRKYLDLMLGNLIENAFKFSEQTDPEIRIRAEQEGKKTAIWVEDNGPGIAPEEQEKIFSEFYQIDKDRTGNIQGTGLGLAIVRHIARAYGGDAGVRSSLGKGSSFWVSF